MSLSFQSTQPEWAATLPGFSQVIMGDISIHAARVGCDLQAAHLLMGQRYFNPRSPSGLRHEGTRRLSASDYFNPRSPSGLRPALAKLWNSPLGFQSTQPEWAATSICAVIKINNKHFNPRSPSGLRLKSSPFCPMVGIISIHAARVGCD